MYVCMYVRMCMYVCTVVQTIIFVLDFSILLDPEKYLNKVLLHVWFSSRKNNNLHTKI